MAWRPPGHTETWEANPKQPFQKVPEPPQSGEGTVLETPGSHREEPAEKLADSAKAEEAGSEAGCQLDKTASQFDRLSADQNGGDSQMES